MHLSAGVSTKKVPLPFYIRRYSSNKIHVIFYTTTDYSTRTNRFLPRRGVDSIQYTIYNTRLLTVSDLSFPDESVNGMTSFDYAPVSLLVTPGAMTSFYSLKRSLQNIYIQVDSTAPDGLLLDLKRARKCFAALWLGHSQATRF